MTMRLTEKSLAAIKIPAGKYRVQIWDDQLSGFGAVVGRTGISFVIQARVNGTQRQQTIGKAGHLRDDGHTWNVQRARIKARELLGDAAAGVDQAAGKRRGGPTLGDALELHVKNLKRKERSPKTIGTIDRELRKHLAQYIDRPILEVNVDVLEEMVEGLLDATPPKMGSVNPPGLALAIRMVRHVSAVWNALDKKHDLQLKNPASRIEMGSLKARGARINNEDFPDWYAKVLTINNPVRRDLQFLTLLTALRASSICPLTWDEIDFKGRMIHAWAKGNTTYSVPLTAPAIAILERRRRGNEESKLYRKYGGAGNWFFPSLTNKRPVNVTHVAEPKQWLKVGERKGVKAVRLVPGLHTLRCTHNSLAMELGIHQEHRERLMNHNGQGVNVRHYGRPQNWDFLESCQAQITALILEKIGIDSL